MNKKLEKKDWVILLKRDLIKIPNNDGPLSQEYTAPENLIITITIKNKIKRSYTTFGGPIWTAVLNLNDPEYLKINFNSHLKKPRQILWNKVKEMSFHFLSA